MALINCPECGRENVSDSADSCPSCGYGIREHFNTIKLQEQNAQKKQLEEQQSKLLDEERIKQKNLEKKYEHEFELKQKKELQEKQKIRKNELANRRLFDVIIVILSIFCAVSLLVACIVGLCITKNIFYLILGIVLILLGIVAIRHSISNLNYTNNEISHKTDEIMIPEFESKLKQWCDTNYIILMKNSKFSKHTSINNKNGNIWISNKDIIFCPDEYYCGNPINISANAIYVKYENIQYYTKDGSIKYTNQVVNNGNNISLSGAIVGGIVAGGVGAIIGSRKDMNQLENITVKHDEVHTYVYYKDNDIIKVLDIEGNDFFQFIIKLIPEKEYYYLLGKQNDK